KASRVQAGVEVAVLDGAPAAEDVAVVQADAVARADTMSQLAQVSNVLEIARAHWAAPVVVIADATGAASIPAGPCREPVHQVLRPGAGPSYAAEPIHVVIEAGGVHADMYVAACLGGDTGTVCAEDGANALQLRPGLRRVAEDRADDFAG